jgi:tRNA nucleotidyltransferase (CCA-adding enzyme)
VYLVGGPLRDVLLGRPSGDIDLAVEGDAARFGKALARELRGTFKSYRQFGTGTVQLGMRNDECGIPKSAFRNPHCGVQVDVARTRTETYASSAALPLVRASDITADLQRRDFTVNAMAWRLAPPGVDGLIDVFNGQDDLRRGVIRVLHEKSFEDDPTRIFRAVRFAVRFGFRIEPRTLNLMHRAIRDRRLELLSGKRVMAELELVMQEIDSGKILGVLNRMGVFAFLSGARLSTDCLKGIARLSDPALRLLYLTSYLGARNWGLAVRDWPLTREQRAVLTSLKAHFRIRQRLLRAERPSRVFSLLESQARDALRIEAALEPEAIADKIAAFLDCYSFVRPSLTGQDLRRMGIRPGPMYTTLLNRLRSARLDGEAKTKEDEEQLVRRIMKDRELRSEKSEGRE